MPAALETVGELLQRLEIVVRTFRSVFPLEDEANDQPMLICLPSFCRFMRREA